MNQLLTHQSFFWYILTSTLFLHPNQSESLIDFWIGLWCNGSTTVFGTVCLGSNPSNPALKSSASFAELFYVEHSNDSLNHFNHHNK